MERVRPHGPDETGAKQPQTVDQLFGLADVQAKTLQTC